MVSWAAGDQAMCVKAITCRDPGGGPDRTPLPESEKPRPPLVYSVVAVLRAEDFPGWTMEDPAPAYLVFAEAGRHPRSKARAAFDCRNFRKLEPLAPDEVDLPESVSDPACRS